MTRSVYVIGSAGAGKSTFMAQLLEKLGGPMSKLLDLHCKPNARGTVVTLRGHQLLAGAGGVYLGCMRDEFPGTDGLDRASSFVGVDWLRAGGAENYRWLIGEGLTLATEPFLSALAEKTDLLLVHLYVEDWIKDIRFRQRGSEQDWGFVKMTTTRSLNLARKIRTKVITADTADQDQWDEVLEEAEKHLLQM